MDNFKKLRMFLYMKICEKTDKQYENELHINQLLFATIFIQENVDFNF